MGLYHTGILVSDTPFSWVMGASGGANRHDKIAGGQCVYVVEDDTNDTITCAGWGCTSLLMTIAPTSRMSLQRKGFHLGLAAEDDHVGGVAVIEDSFLHISDCKERSNGNRDDPETKAREGRRGAVETKMDNGVAAGFRTDLPINPIFIVPPDDLPQTSNKVFSLFAR